MVDIEVRQIEGQKQLVVKGTIDLANALSCQESLISGMNGSNKVTLDMAGLTFIDSTGVGSLVTTIKYAHSKGIKINLTNVPGEINEIFEIIGIYDVLNSWEDGH